MEIEKEETKLNQTVKESVWEIVRFALVALAIVIPIRMFIAEPFLVSGNSMIPNFENSDYLIVDKISYRFEEPKRYDVIVLKYPNNPKKFYIKRIIGLPNETITIKNNEVMINNGREEITLDETYINDKNAFKDNLSLTLNSDEYFVMGDNRGASSDSRYWGPLKRNFIVGNPFIRLLPLNNINLWPGNYKNN